MTSTLFEIGADMRALEDLLTEAGGDVTEEQFAAVDAWFAENAASLRGKLDGYGALIRELEGRAKIRREEAARLTALAQTDENAVKNLKSRLLYFMQEQGEAKLESNLFKFSVCANGGKAPLALACDPADVPAEYTKTQISPDVDAIRAALEAGADLDFAFLEERGCHLRVK